MKQHFPGYFRPTNAEFEQLWRAGVFAFDASILLGLYRSSSETQGTFFDIAEKLKGRIFVPYQACHEYLNRRVGEISDRAKKYKAIRETAQGFARGLSSAIGQHDLPKKDELIGLGAKASADVEALVTAAEAGEADLHERDHLLERYSELFDGAVGEPFSDVRLDDIYREGELRYSKKIPPGYEDAKKGDTRQFGDLVIWFELIERAKNGAQGLIFVTSDSKEDWWDRHDGKTQGPRPELGQELYKKSKVRFWMYPMSRFMEEAAGHLNLSEDVASAVKEIAEIEKKSGDEAKAFNRGDTRAYSSEEPTDAGLRALARILGTESGPPSAPLVTGPDASADPLFLNGAVFKGGGTRWVSRLLIRTGVQERAGWIPLNLAFEDLAAKQAPRVITISMRRSSILKDWVGYREHVITIIEDWLGDPPDVSFIAIP